MRGVIAFIARGVDHREVGDRVVRSRQLCGGYLMMTAISAAIAILGLLLSSPAGGGSGGAALPRRAARPHPGSGRRAHGDA